MSPPFFIQRQDLEPSQSRYELSNEPIIGGYQSIYDLDQNLLYITATIAPAASVKRLNEKVIPMGKRLARSIHTPIDCQSKLNRGTLVLFDQKYDSNAASFIGEVKSRTLQQAGKQLGFNLTLNCYDQAASNLEEWLESQTTLPVMRPIFKDKGDLDSIQGIAKAFDVAPMDTSGVHCEANLATIKQSMGSYGQVICT